MKHERSREQLLRENTLLRRRDRRNKAAIAKLRQEKRALAEIAFTDELTGFLRRTPLIDRLERELRPYPTEKRAPHNGTESVAILALDLVGFKSINDTLGHEDADETLKLAAKAIQSSIRANDLAARWGGDEFRVALWNVTKETMYVVIERILQQIRAIGHGMNIRIGAVVWERDSGITVSAASLLRAADDNERSLKRNAKTGPLLTVYGQ